MLNLNFGVISEQNEIVIESLKDILAEIQEYVNKFPAIQNFKFFQITITGAVTDYEYKHNLNFIPKDVILLSVTPSTSTVTFKPQSFDRDFVVFDTTGACVIRCLIGSHSEVG